MAGRKTKKFWTPPFERSEIRLGLGECIEAGKTVCHLREFEEVVPLNVVLQECVLVLRKSEVGEPLGHLYWVVEKTR